MLLYNKGDISSQVSSSSSVPYNPHNKSVRLSSIRATDFKYNTRVIPPPPGNGKQELFIKNFKKEVIDAVDVFCKQKCKNC